MIGVSGAAHKSQPNSIAKGAVPTEEQVSSRWRIGVALTGIVGTVSLSASYIVNPGPPAADTLEQALRFLAVNSTAVEIGAWLQGAGSALTVIFALALVQLLGAGGKLAGKVTLLSGAAIVAVSLGETALYLTPLQQQAPGSDPAAIDAVTIVLIKGLQHCYLIAPTLLLPLGVAVLQSAAFSRWFGYAALALGATLQILGLLGVFSVLQSVVDVLLPIQSLWFVGAAIAVLLPGLPRSRTLRIAVAIAVLGVVVAVFANLSYYMARNFNQ